MMHIDEYDRFIHPSTFTMRPTQLPRDIILRVVLYLIPLPALWWIRHDFHYHRNIREPMLHEIFGTGLLPTHIDMSRYRTWIVPPVVCPNWPRIPLTPTSNTPISHLACGRNHLHDTVSRIHLALFEVVYWAPRSSISRINLIRTIKRCRTHEQHWTHLRPHYPLRTHRFTSRFIITNNLDHQILTSIEWSWHISDVVVWHPGANYLLAYETHMLDELSFDSFTGTNDELNPTYPMETRFIERDDPNGTPWHPGYHMNGTPSDQTNTRPPACTFSVPMTARHTQKLILGLRQHQHTDHSIHFDILNNDYCLTSHLLAGETMTIPINAPQQTTTQQQQQQQQNIMYTRNARRGYTVADIATHMHTADVFFSFRTHGDRRLQTTLMRHLSQAPRDNGNTTAFDLIVQRRPSGTTNDTHNQMVHLDPTPQGTTSINDD